MFSRAFDDFEKDPFFNFGSSPFKGSAFFDPFGIESDGRQMARLPAPDEVKDRRRRSDALVPHRRERRERRRGGERDERDDALAVPGFGSFGQHFSSVFDGMNRMMEGMSRQMRDMQAAAAREDFDGHMYSHSSVYSYSSNGKEEPQVYHAMSETRAGPGGVRETRRALRDTRAHEEKMAVGRHIGQRGHTVERRRDTKTGDRQEDHHFHGIDEADGRQFDSEWQSKADALASRFNEARGIEDRRERRDRRDRRQEQRAITDGAARHRL